MLATNVCVFVKLGFATMYVSTMVEDDIIVVESFGGVETNLLVM